MSDLITFPSKDLGGRSLYHMHLEDIQEWPSVIEGLGQHFSLFLAIDARGQPDAVFLNLVRKLFGQGMAVHYHWGPDCFHVYNLFCTPFNIQELGFEDKPHVRGGFNNEGSLDEALYGYLYTMEPDKEYHATCRSALGVSVGDVKWSKVIQGCFSDPQGFINTMVDSDPFVKQMLPRGSGDTHRSR
jgi:hypothetical protein